MDWSTVALSAVVSAVVAGVIASGVNLALGGSVEVAKERALTAYRLRVELDQQVRIVLNAVRMLADSNRSWGARGGTMRPWDSGQEFDEAFEEGLRAYLAARPLISGHPEGTVQHTTGEALLAAGSCMNRVRKFREEAVGQPADAFRAHHQDMVEDLTEADRLLQSTSRHLRARALTGRVENRRLRRLLDDMQQRGDNGTFPRTPLSYTGALAQLKPTSDESRDS